VRYPATRYGKHGELDLNVSDMLELFLVTMPRGSKKPRGGWATRSKGGSPKKLLIQNMTSLDASTYLVDGKNLFFA
jgi:hypothetical protein